MKIKLTNIKVDKERYRRTFPEIEALSKSISEIGLLHPIVIDDSNQLIAGERRYRAHILLKKEEIECKILSNLSALDKKLIELEENVRREDLNWQEEVTAIATLHALYQTKHGDTFNRKSGGGWTITDTQELIGGVSFGKLSQDIKLGNEILKRESFKNDYSKSKENILEKEVKRLEKGSDFTTLQTKSAAFKMLRGNEDIALRTILASIEVVETKTSGATLTNCDCLEGLKKLPPNHVDLVLTDPPWGINLDNTNYKDFRPTGELVKVDDHTDIKFLAPIIKELFRVMKDDSHLYMFFAYKHYQTLYDMLKESEFSVSRVPLHWWKRNAFNANAYSTFDNDYESFFFAKKGTRRLTKTRGSVFDYSPVIASLKRHQAEKPVPLLKELIELSTVENEIVLEPFSGSGATLVAANECGRRSIGFELDEKHYTMSLDRLKDTSE